MKINGNGKVIKATKVAAGILIGIGVEQIVTSTIDTVVDKDIKFYKRAGVVVAAIAIGCVVGEALTRYSNQQIDEVVELFNDIQEGLN